MKCHSVTFILQLFNAQVYVFTSVKIFFIEGGRDGIVKSANQEAKQG